MPILPEILNAVDREDPLQSSEVRKLLLLGSCFLVGVIEGPATG